MEILNEKQKMDTKEEIRKGYLISSDMKKVWNVQMDICRKIFEVCNKYDIKIVCGGGTSIGVLREHGYIPWDDDIDLEMLREDYDKLCSVAEKEFREPYFFQNAYTDKGYCYGHAQVRKSGTAAILRGDVFKNIHLGIFVDIFVLDTVPASSRELQVLCDKTSLLQEAMFFKSFEHIYWENPKNYLKQLFKYFRFLPFSVRSLFCKYEALFRNVKNPVSDDVCAMAFTWKDFEKNIRPRSMMDKITWHPFEDMQMPVPDKIEAILTRKYGDFMKPAKAPSMHGGFLVLDAEHDYHTYLPELRKKALKQRFRKLLMKLGLRKNE